MGLLHIDDNLIINVDRVTRILLRTQSRTERRDTPIPGRPDIESYHFVEVVEKTALVYLCDAAAPVGLKGNNVEAFLAYLGSIPDLRKLDGEGDPRGLGLQEDGSGRLAAASRP